MNPAMQVEQIDIDRANRWLDRPSDTPARRSERDRLAVRFARHRHQARAEVVGEIVAWLRTKDNYDFDDLAIDIEAKFGEACHD